MRFWRSNARPAMREGRHWCNSQETGVEAGLALEKRRELVAGDAVVLALRRRSSQTFRPIRTTMRWRRCGSGAACLWDVRVAGVYGIGVAVRAAALPRVMAPAADVRRRRGAAVADRVRGRRSRAETRLSFRRIAVNCGGLTVGDHKPWRTTDHKPFSNLTAIIHIVKAMSISRTRQEDGLAKMGRSLVAP